MTKKPTLKSKVTTEPERTQEEMIDNIFKMAEVLPRSIERATKGGTDGAIDAVKQLLKEMLEAAHKSNLLRDAVLRVVRKLSKEEQQIFEAMDHLDWDALRRKAETLVEAFKDSRKTKSDAAVVTLKGTLAELIFYRSAPFTEALNRARQRAQDFRLDPKRVRLVRTVEARSLDKKGKSVFRELTDGILVAERDDGRFQILTIFEMKSRSNIKDLVRRKSDELELIEELEAGRAFVQEGQIGADIERLRELDLRFDGTVISAGETLFGRVRTEWVGVTPKDATMSGKDIKRIQEVIKNFTPVQQRVGDSALNEVCESLLRLLVDLRK